MPLRSLTYFNGDCTGDLTSFSLSSSMRIEKSVTVHCAVSTGPFCMVWAAYFVFTL